MGYLFLTLALAAGITKGYCGKQISNTVKGFSEALFANIVRMLLCIVIGFFISGGNVFVSDKMFFVSSILSGISTALFVVTWLFAVRSNAFMFVEVANTVGVLIPVISGIFLFNANVTTKQWIGIAILVLAVYVMSTYNKSINNKMRVKDIFILVMCGISYGLTSLSQKMFVEYTKDIPAVTFNFYTYFIAFAFLFIWYQINEVLHKNKGCPKEKMKFSGWVKSYGVYIFIMSVCLFLNSYFNTIAADYLDPVAMYPLVQGTSLIAASLMAVFAYKEKMSVNGIIGIVLSFVGILFINVL